MSAYVLSADAERDLDHIWDFIAEDSIDMADRWLERLFDAFENLAQTPGLGHRRDDLTAHPVLFRPLGSYLIIYRASPSTRPRTPVRQGRMFRTWREMTIPVPS